MGGGGGGRAQAPPASLLSQPLHNSVGLGYFQAQFRTVAHGNINNKLRRKISTSSITYYCHVIIANLVIHVYNQ